MSIDICHKCASYIDTDADVDCYYREAEDGSLQQSEPTCEVCRERG